MDGFRDQLFACSAFALDQDGRRILGRDLNLGINLANRLRGADHSVEFVQNDIFGFAGLMGFKPSQRAISRRADNGEQLHLFFRKRRLVLPAYHINSALPRFGQQRHPRHDFFLAIHFCRPEIDAVLRHCGNVTCFADDLIARFDSDGSGDDTCRTFQKYQRSMRQGRPHGFFNRGDQSLCRFDRGCRKREPIGRLEIPVLTEIVMGIRNCGRRSLLHVAVALLESLASIPPPRYA